MASVLTDKDSKILRAFQRQVERLRNSSLLSEGKMSIQKTFRIDLATGERKFSFAGYDPDRFQAQLPILRQFVLTGDSINFNRVCNIIRKSCQRPELVEWIDAARTEWKEAFKAVPEASEQMLFGVETNLEEALDKLFYGFGGLFHVDLDKPGEEAEAKSIEGALIHSAFPRLWNSLRNIDSVIFFWLDSPKSPIPTVKEVAERNARMTEAERVKGSD